MVALWEGGMYTIFEAQRQPCYVLITLSEYASSSPKCFIKPIWTSSGRILCNYMHIVPEVRNKEKQQAYPTALCPRMYLLIHCPFKS